MAVCPLAPHAVREKSWKSPAPAGPMYQAGTLSGNPLAMVAGIETLKIYLNRAPTKRWTEKRRL